jgi:hypothetical protein
MWVEEGDLSIRICTPVLSEPFYRSCIVGAHRHISRRRSVSCCFECGRTCNTFFLVLNASARRKGVNKDSDGRSERKMETRYLHGRQASPFLRVSLLRISGWEGGS